ncbi:MAG TPA: YXWGXW repeat-containing protein [Verrucomicrobiae bacterium]|nr:YXWGXW repeat-containing protein [Verrucomicrobiae bacterium]
MKTNWRIPVLTVASSAVLLTGCQYPNGDPNYTGTGALTGGALGAATGAVLAGPRNAGAGALIGGALGAITGGIIGSGMDEEQRERLRAQAPQTYVRVEQGQPLGLADIKALAQAHVSDEVIINQIQSTHSVYHLSSADIIDLHNAGVSDRVIDFMINTQNSPDAAAATSTTVVVQEPPPPPPAETVVVAPAPGYVWIDGEWVWRGHWVWVAGHWAPPPPGYHIWVHGYWYHGPRGWHHVPGHWR